jgi:hypothetical protein
VQDNKIVSNVWLPQNLYAKNIVKSLGYSIYKYKNEIDVFEELLKFANSKTSSLKNEHNFLYLGRIKGKKAIIDINQDSIQELIEEYSNKYRRDFIHNAQTPPTLEDISNIKTPIRFVYFTERLNYPRYHYGKALKWQYNADVTNILYGYTDSIGVWWPEAIRITRSKRAISIARGMFMECSQYGKGTEMIIFEDGVEIFEGNFIRFGKNEANPQRNKFRGKYLWLKKLANKEYKYMKAEEVTVRAKLNLSIRGSRLSKNLIIKPGYASEEEEEVEDFMQLETKIKREIELDEPIFNEIFKMLANSKIARIFENITVDYTLYICKHKHMINELIRCLLSKNW